jgi:hypothetical protein
LDLDIFQEGNPMKRNVSVFLILLLGVSTEGAQAISPEPQRAFISPQHPMVYNFEKEVTIDMNVSGVAYGLELLWTANTTGTNYEESAVTYTNGIAYIGSCSTHGAGHDKLFAVDTNTGELLEENSDTYTLESLPAGGSQTLLICQEPFFSVTITRPEKALYVAHTKIFPFFVPFLFGSSEVQASVHEVNKSQIDRVEFYIDEKLQETDTIAPFSWLWSQRSFGTHVIIVIAYKNDKRVSNELKVLKIL